MKRTGKSRPLVGVVMGSDSDYPIMRGAAEVCMEFNVPCEIRVVSAHRTPLAMVQYARRARSRGIRVIIAGAGGAAHLPGMVASCTAMPVIGVPVKSTALSGMDSLLSIVQMPTGAPVAAVAIDGARNAGLLAIQILAGSNDALYRKLLEYKHELIRLCRQKDRALKKRWRADLRALLTSVQRPPQAAR